jgi:hypothetical protein
LFDAVKTHISDQKSNKSKRINTSVASTSGIPNKKMSKDYVVANTDSDVEENDILDSDKCIVCRRQNVKDIGKLPYLTIVNWGFCDRCDGWVHLKFCSPVRVLRRNDTILCPSCSYEQKSYLLNYFI